MTMDSAKFKAKFEEARGRILNNFKALGPSRKRVLLCGGGYPGIWLEHNQDNLFTTEFAPEEAWNSMEIFMDCQREDGLFPFAVWLIGTSDPYGVPQYWHVQNVLPFARCAMEVADKVGKPESCYARIYDSARRFDKWLETYRDTRKTGLVEMFCTWDTGHDNSPRVQCPEIPLACPEENACNLKKTDLVPLLSVDLSAMRYGALEALARLARLLGKDREAEEHLEKRALLREKILKYLYDPEDEFFYDVRPDGRFHKFRSEHVTRLFLNRVLTQSEFDRVYERYFTTEGREFRPAYPIPSMSVDDPSFDRRLPHNSWGCNSQALTMLRALLWMKEYHREEDLETFHRKWVEATVDRDTDYPQELDPFTGAPILSEKSKLKDYTPTLLLVLEYGKKHPELLA